MAGEYSPLLSKIGDSCSPGVGTGQKKEWDQELTDTLTVFAAENPYIKKAAFLLRDAVILEKSTSSFAHTDYHISIKGDEGPVSYNSFGFAHLCRKFLIHPFVDGFLRLCIFAMVLLSFIEPPFWCRDFDSGDSKGCEAALSMTGVPAFYSDDSEAVNQPYYPNTGTTMITLHQSIGLEWFLVIVLVCHMFLCFGKDGFSLERFFYINIARMDVDTLTKRKIRIASIFRYIRVIALLLLVKGMVSYSDETHERPFAILLRIIIFVTFSEGLQNEIMIVFEIIPALLSIGLVLAMVIGFYGFVGVAAFYNTSEGTQHFSNFIEAAWTLFTSMTTVVYPDVMMAGYNDNRFVALYFISYMCLTFFFFQNVILGSICNIYNTSKETKEKELDQVREDLCREAFKLLSGEDVNYVTRQQLMGVFLILNDDCDEIDSIPQQEAEVMFSILDKDGSEMLELEEFICFGQAMCLEFEEFVKYESIIERKFPAILESARYIELKNVVSSTAFDRVVDVAVLLNAFVVLVQSYPMLAGKTVAEDPRVEDGLIDTSWEIAETAFTLFYTFEMTSKILVFGWNRYSSSFRNLFDGLITVSSILATLYVYYPNSYSDTNLIRFCVVVRVFRIFRLFLAIKPFNAIAKTFVGILPAAARVTLLLFCIVYVFSWIGMYMFGGLITRDPNNPTSLLLDGTDFAGALYWANNFNDMLSGANVCFNLLVINNWNVMESGILPVSETKYSRYFFFSFYVIGVMIVNNLVVALVIDYFLDELDNSDEEIDEVFTNGRQLVFQSEDLPTTRKYGKYVARVKPRYRLTAKNSKEVLKELFSARNRGHET